MTTTTDVITATIYRPTVVTVPRAIGPDTAPVAVRDAVQVYLTLADADAVQAVALAHIAEALLDGGAVCVLYTHDGTSTARVIYPGKVSVTKDNAVVIGGYCTFRKEYRCFRLDAMETVHPVTLPYEQVSAPAA